MPSFFKRKPNPYSNPHHPSHNPIPKNLSANTTTASTAAPRAQSQPFIPPRPASPRGSSDFLAEARRLAGRDPVTGRVRPSETAMEPNQSSNSPPNQNQTRGIAGGRSANTTRPTANTEMSAFLNRSSQSPQNTGNRYDLFSRECQAQQEYDERVRAARGGVEYYAPERQVSEFYSGPVEWIEDRGTGNGYWNRNVNGGGSGYQSGGGWVSSGSDGYRGDLNYAQRAKENRSTLR